MMNNSSMGSLPLTVLMPVYNGERFLNPAIESILAQTFTDFEFLIINNGSTDQTAMILDEYQHKDSRIGKSLEYWPPGSPGEIHRSNGRR